jgi:hypothetical protein
MSHPAQCHASPQGSQLSRHQGVARIPAFMHFSLIVHQCPIEDYQTLLQANAA